MKASIWKVQVILLDHKSLVSGIAINGSPNILKKEDKSGRTFRKVVKSYFTSPLKNKSLLIKFDGQSTEVITNTHGEFNAEFAYSNTNTIQVFDDKGKLLPILQDYPIFFDESELQNVVITDIDDTIIQSHSQNSLKKLKLLLFKSPAKRKKIEATSRAFKLFKDLDYDFIYLSRSEYNLFNLISSFIHFNKLPTGPIFLREYTLWRKLFKQKGKDLFKYAQLDKILKQYPLKKIVFFGDDSQFDLDVYSHYEEIFSDKIRAIFIHRVNKEISGQEKEWKKLQNIENVYFYSNFEEIEKTIKNLNDENTIRS